MDLNKKDNLALDFKSATLYAVRIVLHSGDTDALIDALKQRMNDAGSFFEGEAVVIDAENVSDTIDWPALLAELRQHRLHPAGVVAQGDNLKQAQDHGLAPVELSAPAPRPASTPASDADVPPVTPQAAPPSTARPRAPSRAPKPAATTPAVAPAALVINRQLRSGQRVYARDTDLIVIGMVSQGAEVIADGNIHVYGPLRGKAMAGARGDASARIFTTQFDPELVAIAGVYRVIESRLDASLHTKPVLIQRDGEALQINALGD